MITVIWITGIILTLATWGTVYRIWEGPALLDRVLASDVLLSILTAALCVLMIVTNSQYFIILLVVISTVGFIGSVTVARFADNSKADEMTPVGRAPESLSARKRRRRQRRRQERTRRVKQAGAAEIAHTEFEHTEATERKKAVSQTEAHRAEGRA